MAERIRSEPEAGRRRVGGAADAGAVQRKIRLLGVSGAKAVQGMIEEVKCGDAEAQIPITAKTESTFDRQVRVEERRTLSIREDILTIGTDLRQAEAGPVKVLMRAETRPGIAGQNGLQAHIRRSKEHLAVDGQHGLSWSTDKAVEIEVRACADPGLHVAAALNAGNAGNQPITRQRAQGPVARILSHRIRIRGIEDMGVVEVHRPIVAGDAERVYRARPVEVRGGAQYAEGFRKSVVETVVEPA